MLVRDLRVALALAQVHDAHRDDFVAVLDELGHEPVERVHSRLVRRHGDEKHARVPRALVALGLGLRGQLCNLHLAATADRQGSVHRHRHGLDRLVFESPKTSVTIGRRRPTVPQESACYARRTHLTSVREERLGLGVERLESYFTPVPAVADAARRPRRHGAGEAGACDAETGDTGVRRVPGCLLVREGRRRARRVRPRRRRQRVRRVATARRVHRHLDR